MKVDSIFLGTADRERAQRYAGTLVEDDGEPSDVDEDDAEADVDKFPIGGKKSKLTKAKGQDSESGSQSDDEERAYLEEVNR